MITMTEQAREAMEYTFSAYPSREFRIVFHKSAGSCCSGFLELIEKPPHRSDEIFEAGGYVFGVEAGLMERVREIRIEAAGKFPILTARNPIYDTSGMI